MLLLCRNKGFMAKKSCLWNIQTHSHWTKTFLSLHVDLLHLETTELDNNYIIFTSNKNAYQRQNLKKIQPLRKKVFTFFTKTGALNM